jgi:hypothetical protein
VARIEVRCSDEQLVRWKRTAGGKPIGVFVRECIEAACGQEADVLEPVRKRRAPLATKAIADTAKAVKKLKKKSGPGLCDRCTRLGAGRPLRSCADGCWDRWEKAGIDPSVKPENHVEAATPPAPSSPEPQQAPALPLPSGAPEESDLLWDDFDVPT